ncbi:uncharacterized protein LY79DRAFT_182364 [Colletotrichum navitas]|uniref:Uncharacterized protein n=1 Tax=Colletotrichum navitas TaxID=681940 RepID=A0AAD8V675_9PEZI|nr:uncharacterized protein LY79DRAFT_182364 [Colletotrichum navitas]KAK1593271.1 hypothetical protein LY79DRAFT_182364 [Colletotrichum navitas]
MWEGCQHNGLELGGRQTRNTHTRVGGCGGGFALGPPPPPPLSIFSPAPWRARPLPFPSHAGPSPVVSTAIQIQEVKMVLKKGGRGRGGQTARDLLRLLVIGKSLECFVIHVYVCGETRKRKRKKKPDPTLLPLSARQGKGPAATFARSGGVPS